MWCFAFTRTSLKVGCSSALLQADKSQHSCERAVPAFLLRPGGSFSASPTQPGAEVQKGRSSSSQMTSFLPLESVSGCSQVPAMSQTCVYQHRAGCSAGVSVNGGLRLCLWQWCCLMPAQCLWNISFLCHAGGHVHYQKGTVGFFKHPSLKM